MYINVYVRLRLLVIINNKLTTHDTMVDGSWSLTNEHTIQLQNI